jgi:proline dehydrogenase
MLRSSLIYLSQAHWARKMITQWHFAWRTASRFVAGDTVGEAISVIEVLNGKGINATLDHLGEHTSTPELARQATNEIIESLIAIDKSGVRSNVSIKLTQIGLELDEGLCEENLRRILSTSQETQNFLRIDMEDSSVVDKTLRLYRKMCAEHNLSKTGVVIQSYLYRSEKDVNQIISEGGRVRLCKGAYKEPPSVAFPKKRDVDINFDLLTKILIDGALASGSTLISDDGRIPPLTAIASHDPNRLSYAKVYAKEIELPDRALEFQMLYGIRRDLQDQTVKEGYPVRVYVPYGTEWYPYFVRRLAENPANLWFFVSNFFRK